MNAGRKPKHEHKPRSGRPRKVTGDVLSAVRAAAKDGAVKAADVAEILGCSAEYAYTLMLRASRAGDWPDGLGMVRRAGVKKPCGGCGREVPAAGPKRCRACDEAANKAAAPPKDAEPGRNWEASKAVEPDAESSRDVAAKCLREWRAATRRTRNIIKGRAS